MITDRRRARPPAPGHDLPVRARPAAWSRRSTRTPTQLAEALAGEQARIIITTLQKFPFVLDKVADLPDRRYAVIVDEAHSSQTGEAAKDLRLALGAATSWSSQPQRLRTPGSSPRPSTPSKRRSPRRSVLGAGRRTCRSSPSPPRPRPGRWRLFGTQEPATGKLRAVPPLLDAAGHRGGLHPRRARQLHDLQDLLAHREGDRRRPRATTARKATRGHRPVRRPAPAQPRPEGRDHRRALPRAHARTRSAGRAKAMVVTSSRLHAVRYKQAIDTLHRREGLHRHRRAGGLLRQGDRRDGVELHRVADERLPRVSQTAEQLRRATSTRC